jgi:hypothetical protein
MKRFTVVSCLLLFFVISVQPLAAQGLGYGFKGGVNMSNFSGSDGDDWDNRTGIAIGGFLSYPLTNMFYIQPEVLYTMKGAKWEFNFAGESYKETLQLDYIEIPVLAKLEIPLRNSNLKPMLYAGPAVAFNVKSNYRIEEDGDTFDEEDEFVKSTDFGFVVGAGIGIPVKSHRIGVEVRYDFGLTSFDDSEDNFDIKNNVLMLMLSFQI